MYFENGNKCFNVTNNAPLPPTGRQYYVCKGNSELINQGPLEKLGLPRELERLDAAFVWGHNSKTYFMAGTAYWRCVIQIQKEFKIFFFFF